MTQQAIDALVNLIQVDQTGPNTFRGSSPASHAFTRVFGGQLFAQMLSAAHQTLPAPRDVHSMHAYFLRPGDQRIPIDFEVHHALDGRSFSNRRVVARQNGKEIATMMASFAVEVAGPEFQQWRPDVAQPHTLPTGIDLSDQYHEVLDYVAGDGALEFRFDAGIRDVPPSQRDRWHVWVRLAGEPPATQIDNSALVAYLSDIFLIETTLRPHDIGWLDDVDFATIDFAMWFHRPFRLHGWHLLSFGAAMARAGRALSYGEVFTADKDALVSMTQEGTTRWRPGRHDDLASRVAAQHAKSEG